MRIAKPTTPASTASTNVSGDVNDIVVFQRDTGMDVDAFEVPDPSEIIPVGGALSVVRVAPLTNVSFTFSLKVSLFFLSLSLSLSLWVCVCVCVSIMFVGIMSTYACVSYVIKLFYLSYFNHLTFSSFILDSPPPLGSFCLDEW